MNRTRSLSSHFLLVALAFITKRNAWVPEVAE